MIDVFASSGFVNVCITAHFECFEGTAKQSTARRYRVVGANLSAVRADS
jgi:hypothetical protein